MGDVQVTVSGWVGSAPEFHSGQGERSDRVTFRIASTPRFFDRSLGSYREHETVWLGVKAWRDLAHNIAASVHVGEPVVVMGRLRTQSYMVGDEEKRYQEVEASMVGHDLTKGTSMFRRASRPRSVDSNQQDEQDAQAVAPADRSEPPAPGTTGRPLEPVGEVSVQAGAA